MLWWKRKGEPVLVQKPSVFLEHYKANSSEDNSKEEISNKKEESSNEDASKEETKDGIFVLRSERILSWIKNINLLINYSPIAKFNKTFFSRFY